MALPNAVNTYHDLICFQYARLIAEAAGIADDGFLWSKYWDLRNENIEMSSITKEDKYQLQEGFGECIYCGKEAETTFDHLIPLSEGGEDTISNQVPACQSCNSSKGSRDVIEWYGDRDEDVPRIVWGKYLKLVYERAEEAEDLDEQLPEEVEEKWDGLDVTRNVSKRIRKRYRGDD
jgi:hypothetical protein